MTRSKPVRMEMASRIHLAAMRTTIGATWLDEHLRDFADDPNARGFGGEVEQARKARRAFLHREGILKEATGRMDGKVLAALEKRDLQDAVKAIAQKPGKDFTETPRSGQISGKQICGTSRPV